MSTRVTLEFEGGEDAKRFVDGVKANHSVILPWEQITVDGATVPARVVEASAVLVVNRAEVEDEDGHLVNGPETLRKVAGTLVLEFDTAEDCEEFWSHVTNARGAVEVREGFDARPLPQIRRMEKF